MGVQDPGALALELDDLDDKSHAIDTAIAGCPSVTASQKAQWASLYAEYLTFSEGARADIGATTRMILFPQGYAQSLEGIATHGAYYEVQINRWADVANTLCGTHIANKPPPPPSTGLDYIKGATELALVVGALYIGYTLVRK